MKEITNEELARLLDFPSLIDALEVAFREDYVVPLRHHHDFENPGVGVDSTLLLMPAWQVGQYLGIKLVTVSPENHRFQLPSINGVYLLFDAVKGIPLARMDAKLLTNLRTAAASALAARYLAREDSTSLLMVGTGALAPFLIQAHATIRPIEKVLIWGRTPSKAWALARQMQETGINAKAVENLKEAVREVDIISCATMSKTPLIKGEWLQPGQHLDLVGSFRPDMREADNEAIRRAEVFVDTLEGATKESGDIVLPIRDGVLRATSIRADLCALCSGHPEWRRESDFITLFKSVGLALEDLAAAKLAYKRLVR